jgi:ketosteroid isomerase-like protein
MAGQMTIEIMDDFANGWNEHDVDKIMSHMTQDCEFALSAGPEKWGNRFEGFDNVKAGYQKVLDMFPDGQWAEPKHFIGGDRGVTQWTFRATAADGGKIEVEGCDLFHFDGDKIKVKNSFRKIRS